MAISLGDAVVTFRADLTDLNKAVGKAAGQMKRDFGNLLGVASQIGKGFTVMGGAITAGLGAIVTSTANAGDEIFDMAKKTGMGTEAVSKWAFALKQSGGDITTLQTAVRGMSNLIDGARQGTGAAVDTLARLNMTVEDFAGLSPEQAFQKLTEAVAQVADPMERAAIAQDVFGKSGMAMLPALSEGRDGLKAMFDEAERAGAVFNEAEAAMGDQFNDALGALTASVQGISKEIAALLIPSLITAVEWVKSIVVIVKDWIAAHPVLTEWIVKVGAVLGGIMLAVGPLLIALPFLISGWAALSAALAPFVATALPIIAVIGIGLVGAFFAMREAIAAARVWVDANWEQIVRIFTTGKEIIVNVLMAAGQAIKGVFTVIAAILSGFGLGVVNAWNDVNSGSESGSQSFLDLLESVAGFIEKWTGVFADLMGQAAQWISAHWDEIAGATAWGVENIVRPLIWLAEQFVYVWGVIADAARGISSAIATVAGWFGWGGGNAAPPNMVPPTQLATGGTVNRGGWAVVGERGPELVNLPRGSTVYDSRQSQAAMAGGGGGVQMGGVSVVVNGVNDPVAIATQVATHLERAIQNKLASRGLRLQRA